MSIESHIIIHFISHQIISFTIINLILIQGKVEGN